jgi:putative endonuclease
MMGRQFCVYILASRKHGTLYIGVTNDLVRRVYQHKEGLIAGFTKRYGVKKLVYYEVFDDPTLAIAREKQLKKWHRDWKIRTIEHDNPDWDDLSARL